MNKVGAIFSGQGSQYAGMGLKLRKHPIGKKIFQEANDILGMDIESLCCDGTNEELAKTEVTQPAIVTCSISAFEIITSEGFEISEIAPYKISVTAGLSVGEYSALVASKALNFSDALRLVKERGLLMAEASRINPGTMMAIIGLDAETTMSICEEASPIGIVQPANYNCPGQIVVSGEKEAIQKVSELAQKAGAKRCIPLDVSGAFHSPLMKPAETGLLKALNNVSFTEPETPFVANVTGDYMNGTDIIKKSLALQLSNPIKWEASIKRITNDDITNFIEFGPGKVLSGLVRRIYPKAKIFNSEDIL